MARRLYVIALRSLSPAQQAVQGMHAVSVYAGSNPGVYTETAIVFLTDTTLEHYEGARFYEPDMGGLLTAVAFESTSRDKTKGLPLALSLRS